MPSATSHIGRPLSRVDGVKKVTGTARYAGEFASADLAYGYVISSEIARGTVVGIDPRAALDVPGVFHVFTHENAPPTAEDDESYRDDVAPANGSPLRPLQGDRVLFSGQPVALVVAKTFELARYAAMLVRVEYQSEEPATELGPLAEGAYQPQGGAVPPRRGDAQQALSSAEAAIDATYYCPMEHHNPMEPFASTAIWDDGRLIVYDKTQGVKNVQRYLCNVFGFQEGELRVVSPFVGGAFGSGLRPQYQAYLATMAARQLHRSVRVVLTRQQMFTLGYRPATRQRVALGADTEGRLKAVLHHATAQTSRFEDFTEAVVMWSGLLYRCENVEFDYRLRPLDVTTPLDMRAPGAAWGVYALECAMDELATKLRIDPVELRLRNYAEEDQIHRRPFSSKRLRECYQQGMERFGWSRRNPQPRSMRDGPARVGWGMATGIWPAERRKAAAQAALTLDGKLQVRSATADIGTGTYTIMTQIAAETLGLPLEHVSFQLGDSVFPQAPVEGGSMTAATVGSAVLAVCRKLQDRLWELARQDGASPLANASREEVMFASGRICLKNAPATGLSLAELVGRAGTDRIEVEAAAEPVSEEQKRSSGFAHSAIFAEVHVDEDLGSIRVTRVVNAVAGGRVLNPKTAGSQIMGAVVQGIGMALEEESVTDHKLGRIMNHNLAEYHVPVNADVGEIDVLFVEEEDRDVNPLGAKGLGELGIVGTAAAVANAVAHATGKRVRNLPITLDKVLFNQPRESF